MKTGDLVEFKEEKTGQFLGVLLRPQSGINILEPELGQYWRVWVVAENDFWYVQEDYLKKV